MSSHSILQVKEQLLLTTQKESRDVFGLLQHCRTSTEIKEKLSEFMEHHSKKKANG
ncbi:hypothetical protein D3C80_1998250 [compost metagenome]